MFFCKLVALTLISHLAKSFRSLQLHDTTYHLLLQHQRQKIHQFWLLISTSFSGCGMMSSSFFPFRVGNSSMDVLIMEIALSISSSVITSGGAKRIMF